VEKRKFENWAATWQYQDKKSRTRRASGGFMTSGFLWFKG
jgi:hypothetical protein